VGGPAGVGENGEVRFWIVTAIEKSTNPRFRGAAWLR